MRTPPALTRLIRHAARRATSPAEAARSESGLSLIEVIMSALIVGLISIGTLTGFASAGRASADSRQHNQALLLATQDEERLRGMNVTELGRLGSKILPTTTENGTIYTIEEQAHFVSAAKEEFACETTGTTADYIQTTSKVTWRSLNHKGSSESISQSSLISVPTSTSLLVNVRNQLNEPVEGATVSAVGKTSGTNQQITPVSGCVIFGALPESKVNVTAIKTGWVNEQGEQEPSPQEVTLSTTSLVSATFTIGAAGSIKGEFESAGSPAQGDTILVSHTGVNQPTVGGTANKWEAAIAEELFPFATPGSPPGENPYTVYAGDCASDNPELVSKKEVTDHTAQVKPGLTTTVKVEVPAATMKLYEGTSTSSALDSNAEAKITNVSCGSTARVMKTVAGELEHKYLPYAEKFTLCLTQLVGGTRYKYTREFANTARTGVNLGTVFMSATANKSTSGC